MAQARFSVVRRAPVDPSVPPVFSVVRNEMYFLPHFLRHYRALGAREFLFLDDGSTDGTLEYLLAQPDCGVVHANLTFGDTIGGKRFGMLAKTFVPREFMPDRWVLTVDADEFLLLPKAFASLGALAGAMQAAGHKVGRALMFDFFPDTLGATDRASFGADPFSLSPNFDVWAVVEWEDRAIQPRVLSTSDGVRPRLFAKLRETSAEMREWPATYKPASMYKAPLVLWGPGTELITAHHCNQPSSDRVMLALAHFKFVPGFRARIAEAIASKAYWNASIEYRFLDIALRELPDWPLAGPRTRRFDAPDALERTGMLYARLPAAPGSN